MEVDSLVTALEQIELATRGFMKTPRRPATRGALLEVLSKWGDALREPYGLDPGLDDVRNVASRRCAAVQANLETMQRTGENGQPGTALVQQVRQLHSTVGALLPPLVKIADRD
jgi:hypothetical protein